MSFACSATELLDFGIKMYRKSSAVCSYKKNRISNVFSRQRDFKRYLPKPKNLVSAVIFVYKKPWQPGYKSWPVFLKYWFAAIEAVINTTTLIQVHWDFITFTHLKLNFKDPGFTTVADRIWVTVLLSVPTATDRYIIEIRFYKGLDWSHCMSTIWAIWMKNVVSTCLGLLPI